MLTMESYLATELCTACTRGDLENIKRLIELGASPRIRDDRGNTLFHLCCSSVQCRLEVLEYLISISGIVDCGFLVNYEGSTLLHLACIAGKLEFVRFLFVQHQDGFESCHDIHGHTPLYYACINQHLDIVSFVCSEAIVLSPDNIYQCVKVSTWEIMTLLLKRISFRNFMDRVIEENHMALANLVIKDNIVQWLDITSFFPLHYSVSLGDMKIVKYLINNIKYNIERIDNDGNRPLHIACAFSGNVELVKYLVEEAGCDINAKGHKDYTSLHWACNRNQLEIVKFLTSKAECNHETEDKDGDRPLHIACTFSGNVKLVKYLVEEAGCDINAKGHKDYTSLHWACAENQLEIVKFLSSKQECNREARAKDGNRPLHIACRFYDNVELVRYLVEEAGCDINAKGQNDYTSLHWACYQNQLEIVKFLTFKQECNHEARDKDDNRPLHIACAFSGNVELVRYLVKEAGCDINAKGHKDYTSLHWACNRNQLEIVKFLTSKAECNHETEEKDGDRPLHIACIFSGNVKLVRYLVEEAGCNINAKGQNGYTSLHIACHKNQLEIVKFLTSKPECNREAGDESSNRPLHIACTLSGNVELVRYLVEEAGCDINAKGNGNYTSLHWACEESQLETVKFLSSKQECNHEARAKDGNRPLHIACRISGNVELVRYLVEEAGCDINAKGQNDYISLHWACYQNELEIVKFLTSKQECNREARDKDDNRPLHIACRFYGNVALVRYLVEEAGCDINAKGQSNHSPLQIACNLKNKLLVKYFISHPECQTLVSLTDVNYDDELRRLLEYHNKFQQALKSSGVICLRAVKCILTGPPGSGKSTLKKRLLNETLLETCNSTGVIDSAIQVKSFRKLQQVSAIVSGLEDNVCKWKKHDLDEEAVYLFERVLSSTLAKPVSSDIGNSILNLKHINENDLVVEDSGKNHDNVYNSSVNSENMETQDDIVTYIHDDNENGDRNYMTLDVIDEKPVISSNIKAVQTLSETVLTNFVINRAKMEDTGTSEQISESSHALLHIIDTGGQPEFHEILPALITGPAINLITFKLTDDIRSCFKITYRSSNGDLKPYESSFTLEEAIFRSLASIACLRQNTIGWTFDELPVKDDSEPAAFLIATHRDCVDKSKVSVVNEQLKLKIQDSVELFHENLVQFLNEEQVIFALDTIRDQKNIEHLQTALHNVILTNFNELNIPVSWCSFNVLLRKSEESIFKLDTCFEIAQKCGISDRDEFMSALWFLHHRVGSIMYYPKVKELEDIVIIDLQLVFDHITQLITSSFTFRGIQRPGSKELFRTTGQFSESAIRRLFLRNDPLTPLKLLSLLKHLHIIAGPMKGLKNENYYFLPCALKPTTLEQDVGNLSMFPGPLLIYFECGYCPVGMFCCLVVHLISTTQQSELKWTLDKPSHYRNKITFLVGKCYDKITLINRATYFEILINRIPKISEALPLSELCLAVYKTLNNSIQIVAESLHYTNKTHHFFGFPCTVCESLLPHPAICEHPNPVAAKCVHGNGFIPLLEQHTLWINEVRL